MLPPDAIGLFAGAIILGAVHGMEPGHGWPIAASYALDKASKWVYGFAASFILGVGHLISSIAMVGVFFFAKSYFELAEVNQPIQIDVFSQTLVLGGPVSLVAGMLLILLGIREYTHGHHHEHDHGGDAQDHDHEHGHDHGHSHADHDHSQGHNHGRVERHGHFDHAPTHDEGHTRPEHEHSHSNDEGILARILGYPPFIGEHSHSHSHSQESVDRSLFGIAWFAFLLGFAHEEEFEIIALCAGSNYCLELMSVYAITVIVGIVGLTLLLIAGYHHFEEKVEQYTPYLPAFSASVLIIMGIGFIAHLF
jgi:nickel/cobalt transporter (NicO) family protein